MPKNIRNFAKILDMRTRLSVNVNKIATLRNSRGGNNPDVLKSALNIEKFGADGITVHPRPDERHIRYQDVRDLKAHLTTEFNIEGNPKESAFVRLVLENQPAQVTLVPDVLDQLTSNSGWDTIKEQSYLKEIISLFKKEGIRVSIFLNPALDLVKAAAETGADRIELYTEPYAVEYLNNPEKAVADYVSCGALAKELGLGLNAGHDLDLNNLAYFAQHVPDLAEVSIGHALISDALVYGLQNTVQLYKRQLSL